MAEVRERHRKAAEAWWAEWNGLDLFADEAHAQGLADADARIVADLRAAADDVCPDMKVDVGVIAIAERRVLLDYAERYEKGEHYGRT